MFYHQGLDINFGL